MQLSVLVRDFSFCLFFLLLKIIFLIQYIWIIVSSSSTPHSPLPPLLPPNLPTFCLLLENNRFLRDNNETCQNRIQYDEAKIVVLKLDMATQHVEKSPKIRYNHQRTTHYCQESHKNTYLIAIIYMQRI